MAAKKQIHALRLPGETRMTDLLETMRAAAVTGRPVDPDMLEAVKALIRDGADTGYRRPGGLLSPIAYAAAIGDPELIRMIVSRGADVEDGGSGSSSPLMIAVRQKNVRAVDALLDMKADPNHPRYNPDTPLMEAVRNRDPAMVRRMLDHGARPNVHPASSLSPLHLAAKAGDSEIMGLLLAAGANPDEVLFGRSTPMILALQEGCVPCVKALIDAGGRGVGHTQDGKGVAALAFEHRLTGVADLFREAAASRNEDLLSGDEAFGDLVSALCREDWSAAAFFFRMGVSPNIRNREHRTALHHMACRNDPRCRMREAAETEAAHFLLTHGADPDLMDSTGHTVLMLAARAGATGMARCLIQGGADVNHVTKTQVSALTYAIRKDDTPLALDLLDAGAHPNTRTLMGMNSSSLLNDAVKRGLSAVVERLLVAGADIDLSGSAGANMMRHAVRSGDMLRILLDHGLDLHQKDGLGRYPITYAMNPDTLAAFEAMLRAGARPYLEDWEGVQPLHFCAENGYADLVALCLEACRDFTTPDDYLPQALWRAIHHGRTDAVRVLLENGVRLKYAAEWDAVLKNARPPETDPDAMARIRELCVREGGMPP